MEAVPWCHVCQAPRAVCCPRHDSRDMVARRRALPDLPALLRGLRRRRDRRPARDPRAPGPPRVARGRRHLAQPDDAVAERRLGLRRRRLLRRASGPGHARGPRRARRRRPASAGSACCSTSSRTTRATATRGSSTRRAGATRATATSTSGPTRRRTAARRTTGESNFGGSAWQLHEPTGQYYLNNFLPSQPDLNWWNDEVREAFDDVLRFWFARGIAGFRIDVCHAIVKDRELRDDPAATPDDHPLIRRRGHKQVFSMNRPEVHDVLRRWRALADAQDPQRVLVGETYVLDLDQLIPFYGEGEDELHLAFNFLFVHAELEAERAAQRSSRASRRSCPAASWPVYTGSNHDAGRLATRWAGDDERRARVALMMLLTLRGTPFLYYGDEIGAARRAARSRDRARPGRAPHRRRGAQPRRLPHADAVGGRARRRVHDRRRDAVAAVRRPRGLQRRRAARGPGLDAAPRARPDRAAPATRRADRRAPTRRCPRRRARGRGGAASASPSRSTCPLRRSRSTGVAGRVAVATDRARDGEAVAGGVRLAAVRGRRGRALGRVTGARAGRARRRRAPGWRRCCRTRAGPTRRCRRRSRATRAASTPCSAATR